MLVGLTTVIAYRKELCGVSNDYQTSQLMNSVLHVRRLRHVRRYSGMNVRQEQFVSDHVYNVVMLSMFILDYQRTVDQGQHQGVVADVNDGIVLRLAACHELDEVFCGDLSYMLKHEYGDGELDALYTKVARTVIADRVVKGFPEGMQDLYKLFWDMYNVDSEFRSAEARIVLAADMLDVYLYMYEEVLHGCGDPIIVQRFNWVRDKLMSKHHQYKLVEEVCNAN